MRSSEGVSRARERIQACAEVARLVWCANTAVAVLAFCFGHVLVGTMASLNAGLGLAAAVYAKQAARYLSVDEETSEVADLGERSASAS